MLNAEKLDDSPRRRRLKWRMMPVLLFFLPLGAFLALATRGDLNWIDGLAGIEAVEIVDIEPTPAPASPPWTFPASFNGGEVYAPGLMNWAEDYEPPEFFAAPETRRQRMIREISGIWRLFFKDEHVKPEDPRWAKIPIYAAQLADAVTIYQETETDRGGRLPVHDSTHQIMAVMVTLETALRAGIQRRSAQREVGLMQVHGHALAGYQRNKVRRTPFLGLLLGARWVAVSINECHPEGVDDQEWTLKSWFGPLSAYGAGSGKAKRDDGTCKTFPIAIARVNLVRMYMKRLKNGE